MHRPALIFDFGNVVAFFDYLKFFNRLGARLGIPGQAVRSQLEAEGFSKLHADFEAGRMTPAAFAETCHRPAGACRAVRGIRARLGRHLLAE